MATNGDNVDIRWAKVVNAGMASCKYNGGFAVVTFKVVVNGTTPVVWAEPTCTKVHPAKVATLQMTPAMAVALTAMLQ